MVARSPARYLAPIALVATLAGIYLVVHNSAAHHRSPAIARQRGSTPHAPATRNRLARARFYFVRPGDNMTSIAANAGIPLPTLEGLNPGLDPNSLQTGQRIRLRQ